MAKKLYEVNVSIQLYLAGITKRVITPLHIPAESADEAKKLIRYDLRLSPEVVDVKEINL